MEHSIQISGLGGFRIIWLGQIISVLATSMSSFALSLWVIQESGSVTIYGPAQFRVFLWNTPYD